MADSYLLILVFCFVLEKMRLKAMCASSFLVDGTSFPTMDQSMAPAPPLLLYLRYSEAQEPDSIWNATRLSAATKQIKH